MTEPKDFPALTPECSVRNLQKSLAFYCDVLGFQIVVERPEVPFATVALGSAWIMLEETSDFHAANDQEFAVERIWNTGILEYPFGRGINFQITVENINALFAAVKAANCHIRAPLEDRWYRVNGKYVGVRQFLVMDPDGYLLRLQEKVGVREDLEEAG